MDILLDTCAILAVGEGIKALGSKSTSIIKDEDSNLFISPVTLGELACLCKKNKLSLSKPWSKWFEIFIELYNCKELIIDRKIIQESYSLPEPFHNDPCDRILAATARIHRMPVMTCDQLLIDSPFVETVW